MKSYTDTIVSISSRSGKQVTARSVHNTFVFPWLIAGGGMLVVAYQWQAPKIVKESVGGKFSNSISWEW